MGSEREQAFKEALKAEQRAKDVREQKRKRKKVVRPKQHLEDEWHRRLTAAFSVQFKSSTWNAKEKSLAGKLLEQDSIGTVIAMIDCFIEQWDGPGTPSFGYFWTKRDSMRAIVKDQARTKKVQRIEEFDPERDGRGPKVGW